jgi:hypothetical protein
MSTIDSKGGVSQQIDTALKKFKTEVFEKPGRTVVSMNQGKLVKSSENNTEIFTTGVNGCNVVAIEGISDRINFGAITHYDPDHISENLDQLEIFGEQIPIINNGEKLLSKFLFPENM